MTPISKLSVSALTCLLLGATALAKDASTAPSAANAPQFQTSDRCLSCQNGLTTATGEDISIGIDWRTSMMANSARDPYWQASVRREALDHASAQAVVEDDCSACHMPIVKYRTKLDAQRSSIFIHFPLLANSQHAQEAADGVTCSVCHQITTENLGHQASFNGEFVVAGPDATGSHPEYGPYDIHPGLQRVMKSSTGGFEPKRGDHIKQSEVCATCHTLITKALDAQGKVIGSLPEQVPYQEWQHSVYRDERTCQSCHMPAVTELAPIAHVLADKRQNVARHEFVASNFFMQRMLSRYHDELYVSAQPQELSAAAERTVKYLQASAASISLAQPRLHNGRLDTDVTVENLGGHKLPTAYPSRRAWLHVVVRDRDHRNIFESGGVNADGSIQGNDNDADPARYEPHYEEIRSADQVQIYESILGDINGAVTTGLLSAATYLKDNRLLPHGFDKTTASPEIAVHGAAFTDPGFNDHGHRLRYSVDVSSAPGPYEVTAELWFQPIGFRWANNLKSYDAAEPRRFTSYFDAMSAGSATMLTSATAATK